MAENEKKDREDRSAVTLVVDYEGVDELYADYTQNLSSGGGFVWTERVMGIDSEVNLLLSFPGLLEPLSIRGIVRWIKDVDTDEGGVGIEFTNFEKESREQFEATLVKIKAGDKDYVQTSIRVLLVEDNCHVAELLHEGLTTCRYTSAMIECVWASRGEEALKMLEEDTFDLLVIDVNLPEMSGPTLISQLRLEPAYQNLPIIAVSSGGQDARRESMAAGANFFIDKPMRLKEIIETLHRLLGILHTLKT